MAAWAHAVMCVDASQVMSGEMPPALLMAIWLGDEPWVNALHVVSTRTALSAERTDDEPSRLTSRLEM